jgi:3-hydroxyisobutyrate dehydrogenase-like beta-hydroxyacid dehydrogenase
MAVNLAAAGYPLVVYSRGPQAVEEVVTQGAQAAASPRQVAGGFTPGFRSRLHDKDLRIALAAGHGYGARDVQVAGRDDLDRTALLTRLDDLAGPAGTPGS